MAERDEAQWTDLLQPLVECQRSLLTALQQDIAALEEVLQTAGDDSQLAQVDLQNMSQKQQHMLSMMTQISKMLHDTAMAIIRNVKG